MTAIFLRILAVSFGIWCAVFFVDGVRPVDRRRHPIRAFPVALMIAAAGFQIITATLAQLDIMFFSTEILGPGTISWLPFVEVWRRPLPLALAELTDVTIRYGALAATIVLILHQLRRPGWWVAGAVIVLAACGIELIRACSPMSTGDVTRPLVAALVTVILARLLSPVVRRPEPTPA